MPYITSSSSTTESRPLTLGGYLRLADATGVAATDTAALQAGINAAAALSSGICIEGNYVTNDELDWTDGFKGILGINSSRILGGVASGYVLYQNHNNTIVDGIIDGVTITGSGATIGGVRLVDTRGFTVRNSYFTNTYEWSLIFATHVGEDATTTIRHTDILIEFNDFSSAAVNVDQVLTFMNADGIVVRDNYFSANSSTGATGYGCNLYQVCSNATIENNWFYSDSAGITYSSGTRNLIIRGNYMTGRRGILGAIPSDNAYTGYTDYADTVRIIDNFFSITEADNPCITLASTYNYDISGNQFIDNNHSCVYLRHGLAAATAAQYPRYGLIGTNWFEGNQKADTSHDIKAPIQFISGASTPATVELDLDILSNVFDDSQGTTQERAVVFYSDHGTTYSSCYINGNTVDSAVEAILAGLSLHRFQGGAVEGTITYGTNPGDLF